MGNLLTGIAKWTYVWVPSLATFVGFFFTFRHYCPKPTIQAPPPGIETRRDSDGPFLHVKLRLGNPGVSTIYCESVILKPQGFKKLTAGPDGHKNVPPEQSSPRRLPFLQFKAKECLHEDQGQTFILGVVPTTERGIHLTGRVLNSRGHSPNQIELGVTLGLIPRARGR